MQVSNPIVGGNTVVGSIKHQWRRKHEFAITLTQQFAGNFFPARRTTHRRVRANATAKHDRSSSHLAAYEELSQEITQITRMLTV